MILYLLNPLPSIASRVSVDSVLPLAPPPPHPPRAPSPLPCSLSCVCCRPPEWPMTKFQTPLSIARHIICWAGIFTYLLFSSSLSLFEFFFAAATSYLTEMSVTVSDIAYTYRQSVYPTLATIFSILVFPKFGRVSCQLSPYLLTYFSTAMDRFFLHLRARSVALVSPLGFQKIFY